jgi:hypothetical protein
MFIATVYGGVAPYLIREGLPAEQVVVNIGLGLELIGLLTIAYGLLRLQNHFNAKTWWEKWGEAWHRLLVGIWQRPRSVTGKVGESVVKTTMGDATGTVRKPPPDELDGRVARLEREIVEAREMISEVRKEQYQQYAELQEETKALRRKLNQETNTLEQNVRTMALDGLVVEGAGLTCLFVGSVLVSKPSIGIGAARAVTHLLGV